MKSLSRRTTLGFSLVELSIVLVILGLIVGGVLAGQSVIRAAQWRKSITEVQAIITATATFRDQYKYLPGDLPTATNYWGAADGGDGAGTDCYVASAPPATCNGDGSGTVGAPNGDITTGPESYRFWEHLNNAGLYKTSLTGTPKAGTTKTLYWDTVIGTNIPASPFDSKVGYDVNNWASVFAINGYKNQATLHISGCCLGGDPNRASPEGGSIKPEEMFGLDTKIDDGKPRFGSVQTRGNAYGSCSLDDSNYDLSNSAKTCEALIGLGF